MTNPFTRHIWTGRSFTLHNVPSGGNIFTYVDDGPNLTCTLLRTLIWVHFVGYHEYEIGDGGSVNPAVGFAFADTNSQNFNGNFPSDDPGNPFVDLIATGSTLLEYTELSSPPNSSGHLTGSVAELLSDATIATDYNVNTFMYGTKTLFVDSNAQRIFVEQPAFEFVSLSFSSGFDHGQSMDIYCQVRTLFKQ